MPIPSRFMPSVRGLLPTDTSATSASNGVVLPSASSCSVTPSGRMSAEATLVSILKENLRFFLRERWNAVMSSVSMVGQILSMNSITVTLVPRRAHTEPSSSPITPPPTTAMVAGTLSMRRAPVEETHVRSVKSLNFMNGSSTGSDPEAMMVFLVLMVVLAPPSPSTSMVCASTNLPQPFTYSTLFFLNSPSIPLVKPSTAVDF
mmetsp:Transcript_27634/g.56603  ORF Transcript_27634/g.56603 Transcript_27634/m.56603 type:complete len:204 (-) Transcript_27634:380-991(-)